MKKIALSLLVASAIAGATISGVAMAAPQGFNNSGAVNSTAPQGFANNAPNTVDAVLRNGYDDQIVTIRGRLTNYLGHDNYEFTDVNGDRIEVELDDDQSWSHISKDMLIDITGEIDKDLLSTTIDVKQAVVVNQAAK